MAITLNLNTPEGVRDYLSSTRRLLKERFKSSAKISVVRVSGGQANHTYRAVTENQEDKSGFIIKYAPPTLALNASVPLSSRRGVSAL